MWASGIPPLCPAILSHEGSRRWIQGSLLTPWPAVDSGEPAHTTKPCQPRDYGSLAVDLGERDAPVEGVPAGLRPSGELCAGPPLP